MSETLLRRGPVHQLAWLDRRTLVVADGDGRVEVTDTTTGSVVAASATDRTVTALAVDSSAGWLAWGDDRGTVELRSSGGRREHTAFREPVDELVWTNRADVRPPDLAVSAGHDVVVLAPGGGERAADRLRRPRSMCVAWVRPGLLAAGGNGGVTFISADGSAPTTPDRMDLLPDLPSPGAVSCVDVDLGGHRLTAGDLRGEVRITSLQTGEELSLDGLGDRIHSCRWWLDGSLLAIAVDDEVTVWASVPFDLEPDPVCTVDLAGLATPLVADRNRRRLAVADLESWVHRLAYDGSVLDVPVRVTGQPRCLAWSPDGTTLAAGTDHGLLLLGS